MKKVPAQANSKEDVSTAEMNKRKRKAKSPVFDGGEDGEYSPLWETSSKLLTLVELSILD